LNALMALPNLIALLLLSPVVFKLTKASKDQ
jgi:AGCS family alanine or glycine:cation symporter